MSTRIRTATTIAAVAAAVALPGAAVAGGSNLEGPVKKTPKGSVEFKATGKKVSKIKAFSLPANCSGGKKIQGSISPPGSAKINGGNFSYSYSSGNFDRFEFEGKLNEKAKKGKGTVSFAGFVDVGGKSTYCSTGTLKWSAK